MPRKSTIEKLPREIRDQIVALRNKNHTLDEIMAHLAKLDMDVDVSRSALGRYSKKIDQVAETIKRSQILASAITEKFGSEDSSRVSRANLEVMHALLQKLMIGADDNNEGIKLDAKDAMFLATALEKIAKADKSHVETQIKVAEERARTEAKTEAADTAAKEARRQGLSAETIEAIKSRILGVEA